MKNKTKYALISAFFFAMAAITAAHAGGYQPPPKPKIEAEANANATADATAEANQQQQQQQAQQQLAEGGAALSDASSDNAVAISNVYMARAFAQDFPITHGCFQGINAGGDKTTVSKSTGAFLGFTFLNNSCHLQALAGAEKDVEIVARFSVVIASIARPSHSMRPKV